MSHRVMEERIQLQVWLDVAEHEIAAAKRSPVVDLAALAAMMRHRDDLTARLARHDEANA